MSNGDRECPNCNEFSLYELGLNIWKCDLCGSEFNDKWLDELPSLSGFSSAETKSAVHALNRYGFIQMTNFGKKRGKSRFAVSLLPLGEDAIKYTQ